MDDKVGTDFKFWDGDIHGTNKEMIENKKIVQDWYGGDWDKPSLVNFYLSEENGSTKVELIHENLPDDEADSFDQGWKDYYLGPLKDYLESK